MEIKLVRVGGCYLRYGFFFTIFGTDLYVFFLKYKEKDKIMDLFEVVVKCVVQVLVDINMFLLMVKL